MTERLREERIVSTPVTIIDTQETETTRNYYGAPTLPAPRNLRSYQKLPQAPTRVYQAPSGTIHDTRHDLLDPLNILSPLHPLSPISIWHQDEITGPPRTKYIAPIETVPYEPPTPTYEEPTRSSWSGSHSGGSGAGRSWDSPSSAESSSSSSSYDSGSSSSYDSGSSSCDSGSSSCD
jgi:hypothetical protein